MSETAIDYTAWDWLPAAADEMESYLRRLLEESGISAHDVAARTKSIASLQRKQREKQYENPMRQATDIVAVRVITYSHTDRERVVELIRSRFAFDLSEDRNPGREMENTPRRGYDCHHIVVSGQRSDSASDWLVSGGKLSRYFAEFGGLEVQVRTVAGHAWAEFEHARRYKGVQYQSVGDGDQATIDQLFGAASDARRALDEIFVAIDRMLARPTIGSSEQQLDSPMQGMELKGGASTSLDEAALSDFLMCRFPDDSEASKKGLEFGLNLAQACNLRTVEALETALESVDSELVVALMNTTVPVTRVRRLDDELLALFSEDYIEKTGGIGQVTTRKQQLEWRFDRLRGKSDRRPYVLRGAGVTAEVANRSFTAIGALREIARCIGAHDGAVGRIVTLNSFSEHDDLPKSARAREVQLSGQHSVWMASNLNRHAAENVMRELLALMPNIELEVRKDGERIIVHA